MLRNFLEIANVKAVLSGIVVSAVVGVSPSYARDLSAHAVFGKLDSKDHYPFVAGIIEGIAFHRYTVGGKDAVGMNCIYDWFYKDDKTLDTIYATLGRYPDYPPAAVISALANRKCAE